MLCAPRWYEELCGVGKEKVKGEEMAREEGKGGGAAELRGERQNLVVSPGGGDALQAPECTQTLSHRGAAQPERARHRALCERERGREEENEVDRVREEEKGKSKRDVGSKGGGGGDVGKLGGGNQKG